MPIMIRTDTAATTTTMTIMMKIITIMIIIVVKNYGFSNEPVLANLRMELLVSQFLSKCLGNVKTLGLVSIC